MNVKSFAFAALILMLAACGGTQTPPAEPPTSDTPGPAAASPASEPTEARDGAGEGRAASGHRFDARLSGYEYPYEVAFFEVEAQRQTLEMAYMDVRPEQANGRTVLLLHGKNFSGAYWGSTIKALVDAGYRVVVPDQIGFGKSSKPRHFQFTFQALATYTKTLLDELGVEKTDVVGHSMGGMLATRFALMFPQTTGRLVLVNPIGLEDWKRVVPYRPVEWWYARELEKTPEGVRAYMKASYFDDQWKEAYDELAEIQAMWTQGPDYERVAWVSALTFDMIFTQPVLYEFPQVEAPTLLIIGLRDRTALGKNLVDEDVAATLGQYPELGRKAADAIPNAQLVELDDIGHVPQYEAFDRYIEALTQFLAR